ncbi:MAG: acyl-CoA-binding domain-containing protein [bacterium]
MDTATQRRCSIIAAAGVITMVVSVSICTALYVLNRRGSQHDDDDEERQNDNRNESWKEDQNNDERQRQQAVLQSLISSLLTEVDSNDKHKDQQQLQILNQLFKESAELVKTSNNTALSNGDKLMLYGLYKQATVGNPSTDKKVNDPEMPRFLEEEDSTPHSL